MATSRRSLTGSSTKKRELVGDSLTGVFDPPPERLAVPGDYLVLLLVTATITTVLAVLGALAAARRPLVDALRDL